MLLQKRAFTRVTFPSLTYGPMLPRDQEMIANLNYIYNCSYVETIQMLWMRITHFYTLLKTFMESGLLQDSIHISVEKTNRHVSSHCGS
jgi:hypothetical protein